MLRILQLKLNLNHKTEDLKKKAAKLLGIREEDIRELRPVKCSLDARKKEDIHYSYVCEIELCNPGLENKLLKRIKPQLLIRAERIRYQHAATGTKPLLHRPVIIGAGPAGLFCAY